MATRTKVFSVTLRDCRIDTFTVSGPGGQHRNSNQTGVRITHEASGAVGVGRESRHQHINKGNAFHRMAESAVFQTWARVEVARLSGRPTVESLVEDAMDAKNLRIEQRGPNGWEPYDERAG